MGHMACLRPYTYTWLSPREVVVLAVLLPDRLPPRGTLRWPTRVLAGASMRVLSKEQWEGCGDTRGGKTNTALKGVLSQNALHLILLKK